MKKWPAKRFATRPVLKYRLKRQAQLGRIHQPEIGENRFPQQRSNLVARRGQRPVKKLCRARLTDARSYVLREYVLHRLPEYPAVRVRARS